MPTKLKYLLLTSFLMLNLFIANAQDSTRVAEKPDMTEVTLGSETAGVMDQAPEMADLMRSNGKIYVVVAVVLTILIGIFLYLIRLDKKISRLEKEK